MSFILSTFAVLSILELGVLVQFYLGKVKNLNFSFPTLFALGLGTICIIFYISGFLQIHLSRALVMTAAFTFSLPFFLDARLKNQALRNIDLYIQGLRKSPKIFLIIFTAFLVVLFMLTFSKAIWGYDAYERWLAKGRVFWVDGGITRENAKIYDPADDHNLWPFAISWLYYVNGDSEEIWVRIIPFIAFLAIIFEFKKHLNIKNWDIKKYSWILILMFTPFLWQTILKENYSGNADIFISLFFLLSIGAIIRKELLFSALFLGFAAFTKNDALPALIAFIALLPIFTRNLIAKSDLKLAFTIALSFLFANLFLKYYYQLGSRYLNQDFSQIISQKPIFKYNLYTAHAFREQFRQIQIWGLGWWIIGLFYVIKIKSLIINRLLLFAIVLIVIQILGYFLVFYVSKEDQASQIATSISRILLQIYPSGLLIAYYLISKGDRQKTNG